MRTLYNNPSLGNNNKRLAHMMIDEIQKVIDQKYSEVNELCALIFEISHEGFGKEEAS